MRSAGGLTSRDEYSTAGSGDLSASLREALLAVGSCVRSTDYNGMSGMLQVGQ